MRVNNLWRKEGGAGGGGIHSSPFRVVCSHDEPSSPSRRCLYYSSSPRAAVVAMSKQHKPRKLPIRRHSVAGTRASPSPRREEKGRSFLRFLMSRPWKQRSVSTPSIDRESQSAMHHRDDTNEGEESSVVVVATVLQPQLYNKRIPVTTTTTVDDIIVKLLSKYAVVAEDKDPSSFYLMETHDRKQGSYSRVLANSEEVRTILQRWAAGKTGYFTLARRPTAVRSEPLFYSTPSLFPPDTSNLFSYQAFVEEGCSQLSQSMSDVSGSTPGADSHLSSSPQKHSGHHGNIPSLVSPYSHGASRKGNQSENNKGSSSLPRLQDTGIFSSFSTSYSRESTPLSPTSPLIVDSPTHQYIVTGSALGAHPSNDSLHGNESGGVSHFHFPSANPGSPSPTEMEGDHGNTSINNTTPDEKEREEEEEEEREMTPESQRRKELSEMMKMSVEGGLGVIMAQIVEEGRPQQVVVEEEGGEKREREEKEEENKEREIEVEKAAEREEVKVEEREEREMEEGANGEKMEEGANGEKMEEEEVVAVEPTDQLQVEEKEKMEEERQEREEQKEQEKEVITVMTLDSSPRPVARATAASHAHQKESSLVTSPVRKTSASFVSWPRRERGDWMNLSDQFQSAMDILDSFSAAMDEKFGTEQTATPQTQSTGTETRSGKEIEKSKKAMPTTPDKKKLVKPEIQADLVSPDRRKRLVEQAARRFPFKRAHTFDVGVSHTPSFGHTHPTSLTPSSSPGQSRAKWEGQDLVSKVRKERLMNDALAKMRKRFSQSAASKNTTS